MSEKKIIICQRGPEKDAGELREANGTLGYAEWMGEKG